MLPKVMKELQSETMSSREISSLTGHRHDQVLRTARSLVAEGVTQSVETLYTHEQNGQNYPEHLLTMRDSIVLVARLSPSFTGAIVDRWQVLEQQAAKVPASFSEALQLAADQAKQLEAVVKEVEASRPAVEFVREYVDASGTAGFRQVCKLLKVKETTFRVFLRQERIMYRRKSRLVGYSQHMNAGRIVANTSVNNGNTHITHVFTSKGVVWVSELWNKRKHIYVEVDRVDH